MFRTISRGLIGATLISFIAISPASAITIVKMDLGGTSPDVLFDLSSGTGELNTQADGDPSPGDTQTNATFLNFVGAQVPNIPANASLTLSSIQADGAPVVFGGSLVNQATVGGEFQLYDQNEILILEGVLEDGILTGPLGTPGSPGPSTGSLFTVNLGTFILSPGADDTIYNLVDPNSAQISMSFTNVTAADGLTSGLLIDNDVLQGFTADVTAQIEASPVPEPTAAGLAMIGAFAVLGLRRRR